MSEYKAIINNFRSRVEGVNRLLYLDELILSTTIGILEERQANLRNCGIDNAHLLGETALTQLKGIRDHESLKPGYKIIHNQCVVLLVSYFSSSMHDLFDKAATLKLINNVPKKVKKKDLKLTLEELNRYKFDLSKNIGSIISSKFDISFQDMGSISTAMNEYFDVELPWDKNVNNIIAMQACRHAIAHAGETVDEQLLNQLRNSEDRDIQKNLSLGQEIKFSPDEIKLGGSEMIKYILTLTEKLCKDE